MTTLAVPAVGAVAILDELPRVDVIDAACESVSVIGDFLNTLLGRVDTAMKALRRNGIRRAKRHLTTIPAKDGGQVGALLNRDFTAAAPNRVWGHQLHLRPSPTLDSSSES